MGERQQGHKKATRNYGSNDMRTPGAGLSNRFSLARLKIWHPSPLVTSLLELPSVTADYDRSMPAKPGHPDEMIATAGQCVVASMLSLSPTLTNCYAYFSEYWNGIPYINLDSVYFLLENILLFWFPMFYGFIWLSRKMARRLSVKFDLNPLVSFAAGEFLAWQGLTLSSMAILSVSFYIDHPSGLYDVLYHYGLATKITCISTYVYAATVYGAALLIYLVRTRLQRYRSKHHGAPENPRHFD